MIFSCSFECPVLNDLFMLFDRHAHLGLSLFPKFLFMSFKYKKIKNMLIINFVYLLALLKCVILLLFFSE